MDLRHLQGASRQSPTAEWPALQRIYHLADRERREPDRWWKAPGFRKRAHAAPSEIKTSQEVESVEPTDEKAVNTIGEHLEPGEQLRGVVPGYTLSGFGRLVVAVTDRRVLVVKSGYLKLSDKGLLWADPLEGVCLWEKVHEGKSVLNAKSGNAMVRFRRADNNGSFGFNPRSGYLSRDGMRGAATLFELIPGRFN